MTVVEDVLNEVRKNKEYKPFDLLYVYNFKNPGFSPFLHCS